MFLWWLEARTDTNNNGATSFVKLVSLLCVSLHLYVPIVIDSCPDSNTLQYAHVMSGD